MAVAVGAADAQVVVRRRRALAWQRRFRRKLVILDTFAGIIASLLTVVVRYGAGGARVGEVDYRVLAVASAAAWVLVVGAGGGYERRVIGLGTEEFRRVANAGV